MAQDTHSEGVKLKRRDGSQHALLGLSSLHSCGFAISSHKKLLKTPLLPGRTEPTPPAPSLQLPAWPSLSENYDEFRPPCPDT